MRRILSICLGFLCLSFPAIAGDVWEGNAAQIRRGEFEQEGMFAASNSFVQDTVIEVANPRTGETIEVTVIQRIEEGSNIFLLLSPQAAEALGISEGDIERVAVQLVEESISGTESEAEELFRKSNLEFTPTETAAVEETPPIEVSTIAESITEGITEEAGDVGETAAEETQPDESADATIEERTAEDIEQEFIWEMASRSPQKNLFLPPRGAETLLAEDETEEEIAVSEEAPVVEVTETEETAADETTAEEQPTATVEPPEPAEIAALSIDPKEPHPPEEKEEAAPSTSVDAPTPVAAEEGTFRALQPLPPEEQLPEAPLVSESVDLPSIAAVDPELNEPQYPLEPEVAREVTVPEVADEEEVTTEELTAVVETIEIAEVTHEEATLEEVSPDTTPEDRVVAVTPAPVQKDLYVEERIGRFYYIQLGAYVDEILARSVVAAYAQSFPVGVFLSGKFYRVLVGPLNRDESGTLLYWFQEKGFEDAFIRSAR